MPIISVIVPVYKVELFIKECIDSILAQTLYDFELILVDDGSPDNCPAICDDYAIKDKRVVVIHKENGGLSSARNAGLSIAKGNYISFVDSDDYISSTFLESLYTAAIKYNSDLVACNFVRFSGKDKSFSCLNKDEQFSFRVFNKKDIKQIPFDINRISFVVSWNKLYKKNLFDSVSFKNSKLHEDEWIVHHLFGRCNKIVTIPDELYFYRQREGSIINGNDKVKTLKSCVDSFGAFYDRYIFSKKNRWKRASFYSGKACLYLLNYILLNHTSSDANLFVRKNFFRTLRMNFFNPKCLRTRMLLIKSYIKKTF